MLKILNCYKLKFINGDWGLGIGDWGLGIGPNPQSPIPNPQSPIPILIYNSYYLELNIKEINHLNNFIYNKWKVNQKN